MPVIVALYALSALLPLLGLTRLLILARREARAVPQPSRSPRQERTATYSQVTAAMPFLVSAVVSRPRAVILDFALIGGGVVAGAAASIWSLFGG